MIPLNKLATTPTYAPFIYPDGIPTDNTYCYQLGGIALSDPSQGLMVQVWYLEITGMGTTATLSSPNTLPTNLFTVADLTWVSLAFDSNMKPAVSYISYGNAYLWWYDATIPGYNIITLPSGSVNPCCTFDDKRPDSVEAGQSDIILSYINNNNLYFRQQRDRFLIEYFLKGSISSLSPNPQLTKIGMNVKYYLQFEFNSGIY